jgi:S-(hydroxymethyl)glutathione dehydrogenase/alcohol dehydrogenase
MKAVILKETNKDLSLWDLEPSPPKFGQVLVKILSSGLCGAQLQEIAGLKGNSRFMPHLLGHEGCAIVEEIGEGVSRVKKGDKVVIHWRKASGIESDFPSYIYKGKQITGGKSTTLSQFSLVSENRVTRVDPDTNEDLCTLMGCGLSTGLSVANKDANIKLGESVLILGAGGVGLSCALGSVFSNASKIYMVDINRDKKKLIESFPWEIEFFHTSELNKLFSCFGKVDCIIDTTGHLPLVSDCLPHLSDSGRCILVAQPPPNSQLTIFEPLKFFPSEGLTIKTSQAGGFNPDIDLPRYLKLFAKDKNLLKKSIDKLITHRYKLSEINNAVNSLRNEAVGRIIIEP